MPQLSELIRGAQSGDAPAMEALIARYSQPIHQECLKMGLSNHADLSHSDLVQEVLLQVWTKIPQFKGQVDDEAHLVKAFELWLRKNARTALSKLYRNRQAQKRSPADNLEPFNDAAQDYGRYRPQQSGPSSIVNKLEQADQVRQALYNCLDEDSRQIVLRHLVDGHTFKEIADSMSLTYDQVRYAFRCAQEKLAQSLK